MIGGGKQRLRREEKPRWESEKFKRGAWHNITPQNRIHFPIRFHLEETFFQVEIAAELGWVLPQFVVWFFTLLDPWLVHGFNNDGDRMIG